MFTWNQQLLPPVPEPSQVRPQPRDRSEIEDLKSRIPIQDLIGRYVPLHRSGDNFTGLCPFHEDRRPSFVIYPRTQSFYCFGCQTHGDVITFIMRIERLTFPEAVNLLRKFALPTA